jgi:hypothetical protein
MGIPLAALEPGAASVLRRKHDREKRGGEIMIKLVPATITSMSFLMLLGPTPSLAAQQCADVESAKVALKSASVSSSRGQDGQSPRDPQGGRRDGSLAGARSQDVQSPRNQDIQAPRGQDVQSPRGQDVQSPRSQDIQSPRNQDIQSPRSQDIQSPRNQDIQSPRNQDVQSPRNQGIQSPRDGNVQQQRAAKLVNEAAAACNAGNTTLASQKAREAMRLLRK